MRRLRNRKGELTPLALFSCPLGGNINYKGVILMGSKQNTRTKLVFLESSKAEPFTTSKAIAEAIEYEHHSITRILRRHESDFEVFGPLGRTVHAVNRPRVQD